jgi:hypothetical protein
MASNVWSHHLSLHFHFSLHLYPIILLASWERSLTVALFLYLGNGFTKYMSGFCYMYGSTTALIYYCRINQTFINLSGLLKILAKRCMYFSDLLVVKNLPGILLYL